MEELSVIWILPETLIPALQYDWCTRKKVRSVSGPEPELWRTVFRKKNSRNAATRRERLYWQSRKHRRDWNDRTD